MEFLIFTKSMKSQKRNILSQDGKKKLHQRSGTEIRPLKKTKGRKSMHKRGTVMSMEKCKIPVGKEWEVTRPVVAHWTEC